MERGRGWRDREASGPSPACMPDSVDGAGLSWERRGNVSLTQPGTLCCDTFRACGDKSPARHTAYYKSDDTGLHMNMNVGGLHKRREVNELSDWQSSNFDARHV